MGIIPRGKVKGQVSARTPVGFQQIKPVISDKVVKQPGEATKNRLLVVCHLRVEKISFEVDCR